MFPPLLLLYFTLLHVIINASSNVPKPVITFLKTFHERNYVNEFKVDGLRYLRDAVSTDGYVLTRKHENEPLTSRVLLYAVKENRKSLYTLYEQYRVNPVPGVQKIYLLKQHQDYLFILCEYLGDQNLYEGVLSIIPKSPAFGQWILRDLIFLYENLMKMKPTLTIPTHFYTKDLIYQHSSKDHLVYRIVSNSYVKDAVSSSFRLKPKEKTTKQHNLYQLQKKYEMSIKGIGEILMEALALKDKQYIVNSHPIKQFDLSQPPLDHHQMKNIERKVSNMKSFVKLLQVFGYSKAEAYLIISSKVPEKLEHVDSKRIKYEILHQIYRIINPSISITPKAYQRNYILATHLGLLMTQSKPEERIGLSEIKTHPFLEEINWHQYRNEISRQQYGKSTKKNYLQLFYQWIISIIQWMKRRTFSKF